VRVTARFARRTPLIVAGALVLGGLGLTASQADAGGVSATFSVGHKVTARVSGVDRVHGATITWGDGTSTILRSRCRSAAADAHPLACTAHDHHAYAKPGRYRITVRWPGHHAIHTIVTAQQAPVAPPTPAPTPAPSPSPTPSPTATPSPASSLPATMPDSWRWEMLDQVNAIRAEVGAESVVMCAALERSAQYYAQLMADKLFFAHVGPDGSTPGDRAQAQSYGSPYVGENIAAGQQNVTEVVTAWRNSPGHYANLVNPRVHHVGFGRAETALGDYHLYWSQEFGVGGSC
jgi:uncharacterized protein YkwD